MNLRYVTWEKEEHIVVITLNRPERLNALGTQMVRDLRAAVDAVEADDDIRVYIITGAPRPDGRACFCAGGDLKESREERAPALRWETVELFAKIEDLLKPSIAAIDGVCTAGGIELAECCDLRVAAETAEMSDFHLRNLGMGLGGAGASSRLPRIIGLPRAKELILTGKVLDGREAERIGLVNACYPSGELLQRAKEMAARIAAMNPKGVKATLAHMDVGGQLHLYQAIRYADIITALLGDDGEGRRTFEEGRRAFQEGRPPAWD